MLSNHQNQGERRFSTLLKLGLSPKEYEKELTRRMIELQRFKKDQAQKLGKFFSNIPLSSRKQLLPKITAALFGETSYEIEIIKHAQAQKSTYSASITK